MFKKKKVNIFMNNLFCIYLQFADTVISSVVFAGSTLTDSGAIWGAANMATSHVDLLIMATTCEQH